MASSAFHRPAHDAQQLLRRLEEDKENLRLHFGAELNSLEAQLRHAESVASAMRVEASTNNSIIAQELRDLDDAARAEQAKESVGAQDQFKGLMELARLSGQTAHTQNRGGCRRCGLTGHMTHSCRNFAAAGATEEAESELGTTLHCELEMLCLAFVDDSNDDLLFSKDSRVPHIGYRRAVVVTTEYCLVVHVLVE